MISTADLLKNYTPPLKPRTAFVEEAYLKMDKQFEKRLIALAINRVCPKGKDNWVWDYRKSCQESDNYGKCFWGIAKRAN